MHRVSIPLLVIVALTLVACGGTGEDAAQSAAGDSAAAQGLSAEDEAQLEQVYQQQAASEITADNAEQVAAELEAEIAAEAE